MHGLSMTRVLGRNPYSAGCGSKRNRQGGKTFVVTRREQGPELDMCAAEESIWDNLVRKMDGRAEEDGFPIRVVPVIWGNSGLNNHSPMTGS
jgi:hypothetical protein